jgi:CxxC motif-containing protein (DUF1111 family)
MAALMSTVSSQDTTITEAPTGFDNLTNGFVSQAQFDADRDIFEQRADISGGLGPTYNAQSCAECHQSPVTGAISQVTDLRAASFVNGIYIDHPGGSHLAARAVDASIQERLFTADNVRAFRTSLNTLGDGFVECIDSNTLLAIANAQPGQSGGRIAGQFIQVPVPEAPGESRGGRFGWKNQQASLLGASAEQYLDEIGITNRLFDTENTSSGRSVDQFDPIKELNGANEDPQNAIDAFAEFMRATKAPPRDAALAVTADAQAGSVLFTQIGCAICHVRDINTAPPGTVINGGTFTVPPALGNKRIHPFSDFLLHDVGTGDGIVQNGGQTTRNKLRTPPLWGLRTRYTLMHGGNHLTRHEAILRHKGEAHFVIHNYKSLTLTQQNQLITFLNSL